LGHQKIQDDRTCTLPRTPFMNRERCDLTANP
jgi:hypothetical protein